MLQKLYTRLIICIQILLVLGLFATKNIPKGTRIAFFKGDLQDSKTTVKMRKNVDGTLGIKEATTYFRNYVTPDPLYDRVMAHPKKEGFMVVASVDQR